MTNASAHLSGAPLGDPLKKEAPTITSQSLELAQIYETFCHKIS
jgi:hypothetical protein